MIDCNTDVHTFSPQAAEQQQQRLQMAAAADLAQRQQLEQQQQLAAERQRLALSQAQAQQPAQSQAAASLLGMGAPQAAPLQVPTAAPAASALSASSPSLLQAPHTAGCPAVSYTYKIDCGDEECKASFINLSKDKPLDWVDVHFVQTDAAHLAALRSHIETSGAWRAQMLELAAVGSVPQLNFQMSLGAGAPPAMAMHSMAGAAGAAAPHQRGLLSMGELSSAAHLNRFGASSSPAALLSETGGQQVWQFPLPLRFKDGDMVGIGFTYCSAGTDCDTEASFYRLHEVDDSEKKQEKGRAQDDEQQMQLLRHAQAKAQLDAPLRLAGISQPRLSLSGAAAGRSPLMMSAHQRLQAALDSDFDLAAEDRLSKEL